MSKAKFEREGNLAEYINHAQLSSSKYFYGLYQKNYKSEEISRCCPEIIVLGCDLPAEIIYAFSDNPYYIQGGSEQTALWAEHLVPRGTDPVCVSMLGYLINDYFDITSRAIILTTLSNDSKKKMVSILRKAGKNVYCIDVRTNIQQRDNYVYQIKNLVMALEKHTKKTLKYSKLKSAYETVIEAERAINEFCITANECGVGSIFTLMISRSIYYAHDLPQWTKVLKSLTEELKCYKKKRCIRFNVLMIGSPIVFPNYKIPQLFEEVNINIAHVLDGTEVEPLSNDGATMKSKDAIIQKISNKYLSDGAIATNIQKFLSLNLSKKTFNIGKIDGIVLHVLKGNIEYDFEFSRIESVAKDANIPIIRLETDYSSNDTEQLRIRVQAFYELLCAGNEVKYE